jgi:hypothetical protein
VTGSPRTWLIALPVAAGSWLSAHCLAYVLVPPAGTEHMHHHVEPGHSYFGSAPVLIATGVTLLAAGLILCLRDGMRGAAASSRQPTALFALLPPLGFSVQEHLEQLIVTGSLPHDLAAEPTFLTGLALQLPFAVVALMLTRALYSLGHGLGRLLADALPAARLTGRLPVWPVRFRARAFLIALPPLGPAHGPRAPPMPTNP